MAAPRDYRKIVDGGGGVIQWDWKNNKYIFVDKGQLNKQLEKLNLNEPCPYDSHARVRKSSSSSNSKRCRSNHRPSYRVPSKKGCRPLRQQNSGSKNDKVLLSSGRGRLRVYSPKKQPAIFKKPAAPAKRIAQPEEKEGRIVVYDKENVPTDHDGKGDGVKKVTKPQSGRVGRPPKELLSEHSTFTSIISSRLIHIRAAKTFWRQSPNAFLSYLIRTEDDAVTVDVLPVMIHHLKNDTSTAKEVSMGVCLDLLPTLRRLLDSKVEDYVKTSLDMLRTILRYWWDDLQTMKKGETEQNMLQSRSIPGIYTSITAMLDKIQSLTKRRGETGSKAKIVESLLQKL